MSPFTVTVKNPETNKETTLTIKEFVPDRGRGQGRPKFYPDNLSTLKVTDLVEIFGEEKIRKTLVMPRLKQLLSVFTEEATTKVVDGKEVPEVDPNTIQKDFADMFGQLSMRGETLASLNARWSEIVDEELGDALDKDDFARAKELKAELDSIREEIKKKKVTRERNVVAEVKEENATPVAA